jgi:hypothetical protein
MQLDRATGWGYLCHCMSREDTTQIKHARREDPQTDLGLETAQLLFAHLDAAAAPEAHAERARNIYDRIRRMASQSAESAAMVRARADTMEATFRPGESGVSPKVR